MRKKKKNILWNTVYILGAEDVATGKLLSTMTETGEIKVEHVVITGIKMGEMPYWDLPVPAMAEIHRVPKQKTPRAYALELGGFAAFGWYFKEGFRRKFVVDKDTVNKARQFKRMFFRPII